MSNLSTYTAVMLTEGEFGLAGYSEHEVTEELILDAWNYLVETGLAWTLPGRVSRAAAELIEAGVIAPGRRDAGGKVPRGSA